MYFSFIIEVFKGGIAIAEMLFKSNIFALVGTKMNPNYPPNKVVVWNDHTGKEALELSFKVPVLGVRLRKDMIVIVTENCIFAYTLAEYKLIDVIDTSSNPHAAFALSYSKDSKVLACPFTKDGYVRIQLYG